MYRKNVANQYIYFALVNTSTGLGLTGASVTAYLALDNGAQATATGTTSELGNGQYRFNLSQADTNADEGSYLFIASGASPVEKTVVFTAANPSDGAAFGLSKFADIETDTQDIQSRLPAALNGGRMVSNAEVVSDSTIAKEATLTNRPTLVQIEASSVLAKEATVNSVLTAIQNLNNLSAKMNVYGTPLMEIPDSGTTTYAFTVVVRDDEDKLVALDASPTIAATNAAGTSRSANLSSVSNPSTGRYTFTYSVASTHPAENLRITISGTVSGEARYVEWIGSVVDYETITTLLAIKAKTDNLPANPAAVSDIPTANQNRDAVWNASTTVTYVDGSMGDRILISNNNTREVSVTGSGHVASVLHDAEPNSIPEDAFQSGALSARVLADGAIDAGSIAAGALNGKGDWLTTLGTNAPANWINAASIAASALNGKGDWLTTLGATAPAGWINDPAIASDAVNKITVNLFKYGDVQRWTSPANQINVTITKVS
jgi:hypothetical protein